MMSFTYLYAGIIVFESLSLSLPAMARPTQDASAARFAVVSAYASMDRALSRRDLAATMVHIAPDVVVIGQDGTQMDGKDKVAGRFRQLFALPLRFASTSRILTFSLHNEGAVVTERSVNTISGTREGKPFVIREIQTIQHFWFKRGGIWMVKREQVLSDSVTPNN